MRRLVIGNKIITQDSPPFIIAEIGSNHGGNMEKAENMVFAANDCGCDAVKLQKRNNKSLFAKAMYDKPYDNENSYGPTYGTHRDALELNRGQHKALKELADELRVIYFATPFDLDSVDDLEAIGVDLYKVASADIKTFPLLRYIGQTGKPVILSTGGAALLDIDRALKEIGHNNVAILHCVATYPTEASQCNLLCIKTLMDRYPDHIIGISDHYDGILSAIGAWMMGARVFEKHFAIEGCRGTDVAFSLSENKMRDMVNDLRKLPLMIGDGIKKVLEQEVDPLRKMGKGIYSSRDIKKDETFDEHNICFKSPSAGMGIEHWYSVLGKPAMSDIPKETTIEWQHVGGEVCLKV